MELLIFAASLLVGSIGFVAWLRLADDARERDEWERFQRAMDDAQNPKEK
jgi:hypothetical protein